MNASNPLCIKTRGQVTTTNSSKIQATTSSIKNAFYSELPTDPFNLSDIFGQSIRLAFHDAAEIDLTNTTDMMGPDGCVIDTIPNFGLVNTTYGRVDKLQQVLLPQVPQLWFNKLPLIIASFWVRFFATAYAKMILMSDIDRVDYSGPTGKLTF